MRFSTPTARFYRAARKYCRLQSRLAQPLDVLTARRLTGKLTHLRKRLMAMNRCWRLGVAASVLSAWLAAPAQGQFAPEFDLDTLDGTNGFALNGANAYDYSGRSVSGAGDVNGDGLDDLIVGADGADPNGFSSGQSYVVFGADSSDGCDLSLSLGSDLFFCAPVSALPLADSTVLGGGTAPFTYWWEGTFLSGGAADANALLSDTAALNPTFAYDQSGSLRYVLTVTDANGCVRQDSLLVIGSAFTPSTAAQADTILPGGSTAMGTTLTGGRPPYTYVWTPAVGLDDPTLPNPTASPNSTTLYTLTLTESIGCQATDSFGGGRYGSVAARRRGAPRAVAAQPDAGVGYAGGRRPFRSRFVRPDGPPPARTLPPARRRPLRPRPDDPADTCCAARWVAKRSCGG